MPPKAKGKAKATPAQHNYPSEEEDYDGKNIATIAAERPFDLPA